MLISNLYTPIKQKQQNNKKNEKNAKKYKMITVWRVCAN